MKKNYKIVSCILALGGIGLILFSRSKLGQERSILAYIGLALILALLVQIILFTIKPSLFKNRPSQPE